MNAMEEIKCEEFARGVISCIAHCFRYHRISSAEAKGKHVQLVTTKFRLDNSLCTIALMCVAAALQPSFAQTTNNFTYDVSGNTLTESAAKGTLNAATGLPNAAGVTQQLTHTYDAKNRVSKTQIGTNPADTVNYKYNALGQRVQKSGTGQYAYSTNATINSATGLSPQGISLNANARFVYDEQGNLIGEYTLDGKMISETVYFDGIPIVTMRPKCATKQQPLGTPGTGPGTANNTGNNTAANPVNIDTFYIHSDHLGTPRAVTRSVAVNGATTAPNAANKAVWMHNSDAFGTSLGNSAPNENPQLVAGTPSQVQAGSFVQNIGFRGQIRDADTGKNQNNFRDYDPRIGRYTSSDPIGLKGGVNTFGYVLQDPLKYVDPKGLDTFVCTGIIDTYPHLAACVNDRCNGFMPNASGIGGFIRTVTIGVPGIWVDESEKWDRTNQCSLYTIPTTCDQNKFDACVLRATMAGTPGHYRYPRHTCVNRTYQVLGECLLSVCGSIN